MSLATLLKPLARASGSKSEGIIISDPAVIASAGKYLDAKRKYDGAESEKKIAEAELKPLCFEAWLAANEGRANPEASVKILSPSGRVTCSFQDRYFPKTSNLVEIGVPEAMVRSKVSMTIDMDEVPADKQEKFAAAVIKAAYDIFGKICDDELKKIIDVKFGEYPTSEFATARHRLGSEVNRKIEVAGLGTVCALRGA